MSEKIVYSSEEETSTTGADALTVEEPVVDTPVKKPRKPRQPLTDEQREALRQRLAKARDAKKTKRENKMKEKPTEAPPPSPVEEPSMKESGDLPIDKESITKQSKPRRTKSTDSPARGKKLSVQIPTVEESPPPPPPEKPKRKYVKKIKNVMSSFDPF